MPAIPTPADARLPPPRRVARPAMLPVMFYAPAVAMPRRYSPGVAMSPDCFAGFVAAPLARIVHR